MLKLEKSKNKKRLCCRLKVFTICTNLQKMETLCQHSPLNKDTNIQTNRAFPLTLENTPLHRVEKQIKSTLNPSTNQKLIFS